MTKIVINTIHGGFGLSHDAMVRYADLKGIKLVAEGTGRSLVPYHYWVDNEAFRDGDIDRDDPVLVQVVEEMGGKANGRYADLKVVEIPDDVQWTIDEYDGSEWVAEVHRTWS